MGRSPPSRGRGGGLAGADWIRVRRMCRRSRLWKGSTRRGSGQGCEAVVGRWDLVPAADDESCPTRPPRPALEVEAGHMAAPRRALSHTLRPLSRVTVPELPSPCYGDGTPPHRTKGLAPRPAPARLLAESGTPCPRNSEGLAPRAGRARSRPSPGSAGELPRAGRHLGPPRRSSPSLLTQCSILTDDRDRNGMKIHSITPLSPSLSRNGRREGHRLTCV